MELPNFLHWGILNALRSEMGAELIPSFINKLDYVPIELPLVELLRDIGLEVKFEDIEVLLDNTLGFKGHRVLLYIRDIPSYGRHAGLPKYHLTFCKKLSEMKSNNRIKRYVVANRDDGFFQVNQVGHDTKPSVVRLDVCQMCLTAIKWNGFQMTLVQEDRKNLVSTFQLTEFFEKYPRDLIAVRPLHSSDTAPLNSYTEDWGDVSENIKRRRGFKCEKCSLSLAIRETKYIQVHHKNGLKYDNSDDNLLVLCIRCHANEHNHGHMKNLPEYLEFERKYAR